MSVPIASSCGASGVMPPSLFVAHAQALSGTSGGLQICTREYLRTLEAAGFALSIKAVEHYRRPLTRLARRLRRRPYPREWHPRLVDEIVTCAGETRARFIFLNLVNLAPLAPLLRPRVGEGCKIVLLSHGLESVDRLHAIREVAGSGAGGRTAQMERMLGRQLAEEAGQRSSIDHVFCLTPFEMEIERWLGTRSVSWLPRTIPDRAPLDWSPVPGRIGFVGTLDHPPNRDGLVQFLNALDALASREIDVRVVGGPLAAGAKLAQRFRRVNYLGVLSDDELEKEAATWTCFVHPLFCYARGCSTKLAVALSWQIPVLTTPPGCRGYVWRDGHLPLADTPDALARLAVTLADPASAVVVQKEVAAIVRSAPTLDDVAQRVRVALASLGGKAEIGR